MVHGIAAARETVIQFHHGPLEARLFRLQIRQRRRHVTRVSQVFRPIGQRHASLAEDLAAGAFSSQVPQFGGACE